MNSVRDLARDASVLRILQVEDVATEAALALRELQRAGLSCEARRVDTEKDFRRELADFHPDIVLSDFSMPLFNGMDALHIAAAEYPRIPFIFLSGTIGEENAIRALKSGATDYVLKSNLIRLPGTLRRAIAEAAERRGRQKVERQLVNSEAGLRRAQAVAKLAHIVVDSRGNFETWSDSLPLLIGIDAVQLPRNSQEWLALIHPDEQEKIRAQFADAAASGGGMDSQYRMRHANGEWIDIEQVIEPLKAVSDSNVQWFCTLQNVTDRKISERKIKRLIRVHAVLSGINAAIVRIRDREKLFRESCHIIVNQGEFTFTRIEVLNAAGGDLIPVAEAGLPSDAAVCDRSSENPNGLLPRRLAEIALRERRPMFDNDIKLDPVDERDPSMPGTTPGAGPGATRSAIAMPLFVNGRTFGILTLCAPEQNFFDDEEVELLTELTDDISFAMEYIEKDEQLNYLAYYDALTGLPNGSLFQDQLAGLIRQAARDRSQVAVVSINFNRFRHLNDTLGRKTGDALLRMIADRLSAISLEGACVAHINADNFVVALADTDGNLLPFVQDQLFRILGEPYLLPGHESRISANGGIALFPGDGPDAETLVRNAEAALKQARVAGERYLFYSREMNAHVADKLKLENKLRQALERQEFVLHYQPKLHIRTGQICGLEALIRWNDPETGRLIPPLQFIPLLEETGLIVQVGAWALGQAALDYRELCSHGISCPRIAVNVSPLQFRQKNFASTVFSATGGIGARVDGIDLEITESVIMENIESNIAQLLAVREMGMHVAIDDFGTGYSSLAYLAKLPVTTLKIDRSFVLAMKDSTEDRAIISTIISLGHSVGLQVVAEGVETQDQQDALCELSCDEMQGYLFSAPVPVAGLRSLLRKSMTA
jgi:diguanylate cyclase (GGDEF)-like protein/PAS domain S-box-containing protein